MKNSHAKAPCRGGEDFSSADLSVLRESEFFSRQLVLICFTALWAKNTPFFEGKKKNFIEEPGVLISKYLDFIC